MAQLLASKVVVVEEDPRVRSIPSLPTAITAFLGIAERGPVNESTLVSNFEEYVSTFGGFTANSDLALGIQGFFQNGGQIAHIVRTVHFTDIANAVTKTSAAGTLTLLTASGAPSSGVSTGTGTEPHDLEPAQKLDFSVDAGGTLTATFNATAGLETSVGTETFALVDAQTLTVSIDGGSAQTITFNTAEFSNIALATAAEVSAVINAEISGAFAAPSIGAVAITSDKRGTGSSVQITGGSANAVLAFPTDLNSGTGNVVDIDAVTGAEAKIVIEAAVAGVTVSTEVGGELTVTSDTTGPASSVQIEATSTAIIFGFDNAVHSGDAGAAGNTLQLDGKTDGTYANLISVVIDPATSGDSAEFNLLVEDDGLVVETWPNLSMIDAATRFVETVLNNAKTGSKYIVATDLDSTASDPTPAEGTFGPLTGGDDGLTLLDDNDFVGSSAGGTGLHAFDQTQELSLLVVPGRATSAVANAMLTYCETWRNKEVFAILDPPEDQSATEIIAYVETTAAILNLSEFGAIYWPRIKVLNPSKPVFGSEDNIVVPPSGYIAGVYARTDGATLGGVYKAPANIERGIINGMLGFETEEVLDERKRDLVYPKRINPLTVFPGAPRHIDGSRTLKGNGNWPSIPERRGVIFIETSIKSGLQFLKHNPNTPDERAKGDRSITSFLLAQMKNNAFASVNPETAFFVQSGADLNTPSVVASGQMIFRIGLAMAKPSEFIIIKVTQDTRALEEELASA